MISLEEARELTRRLLDPSRMDAHGPLTDEDIPALVTIARELIEHNPVPPNGWRWWCDFLTWMGQDGKTPIGGLRGGPRILTIAIIARDAQVPQGATYGGTLRPEEYDRVASVVTAFRDLVMGRALAFALERASAVGAALRSAAPDNPAIIAFIERVYDDQCAVLTRAMEPLRPADDLVYTASAPAVSLGTVTELNARSLFDRVRCGGCGYIWRPRVPHPVKCPACQVRVTWPTDVQ